MKARNPRLTEQDPFEQDSMTLRDYFAIRFAQTLSLEYFKEDTTMRDEINNPMDISKLAFKFADAMLKERSKTK